MLSLLQDLRYAVRQLRQSPGFTVAAVISLAIGIGANTSGFSIMDALILRPLAVPDLDRVMTVREAQNHGDDLKLAAAANFEDWQQQSHSFEEMAFQRSASLSLTGAGDAASVTAVYVSPNFFSVLRSDALAGRLFNSGEAQPGRSNVVVLNYYFWKQQFNSDPGVVGRQIVLDQHNYTVIGVLPKTMQYLGYADLFIPFAPDAAGRADRTTHDAMVIGRLRPGVTQEQAQAEIGVIAEGLARAYPATNQGWSVRLEPLLRSINGDKTPQYFHLMQGATLFVLLVVCLNIANLQLARGVQRRPELAMRIALGASRWRILRQLLTENILLGVLGAAGGVLVALVDLHMVLLSMPDVMARRLAGWSTISLNGHALAYSLLLAVGAGVVCGLTPALDALRINLAGQLKSGSRSLAGAVRGRWVRNAFAVAQIALAMALVVGAALMAKGMGSMLHAADRYNPGQTLIFDVHLPAARYDTPEKRAAWQSAALDKLRALPGVKSAETTTGLPLIDDAPQEDCQIENKPLPPGSFRSTLHVVVSAGYFSVFHVGLISGRFFSPSDDLHSTPVAVVSRGFAERYLPGENPLGRRVHMGAGDGAWLTIVGVSEETKFSYWDESEKVAVYQSRAQLSPADTTYAVVGEGDPIALAPAARKALAQLDPALPLDAVQNYEQRIGDELIGLKYVADGLNKDGGIALLLAAIGIFAVMANLVVERTSEIGVRLAMGARRQDILSIILRRAAWLTGVGVSIGLLLAFALAHGAASLLYGVHPGDPAVFAGITLAIVLVSLGSSWLPARRASRIDPMVALRDE
ncbi:MAG: ABC transporter permease [Terracidiphilus sp.]|jgi:predicted permease